MQSLARMLLLHVANKASMSTTTTVSTTVAVSENGPYNNGCQWKRVSSWVRKWRDVLMASLLCEWIPVNCLYMLRRSPTVQSTISLPLMARLRCDRHHSDTN
ncbi:MAG TPA: hypothetical protein VFV92_05265 [Candidatus Bathyarchaeia archaeon]|nr:hypothetical protein [Candidatus Bathyarchaeia archaeon]